MPRHAVSSCPPVLSLALALATACATAGRRSPAHGEFVAAAAAGPAARPPPGDGGAPEPASDGTPRPRASSDASGVAGEVSPGAEAPAAATPHDPPPSESAGRPSAAPEPTVELETPHLLFRRKRPRGEVAAAVADEALARWNVGGTSDPAFVSSRSGYHPGARVVVDTRVLGTRLPRYASKRRGTLSEWAITAAARKWSYWPYRLCYEAGLRRNPKQEGKTTLRIVIGTDGRVTSARPVSTKLDDATAKCLLERARDVPRLVFRPPPSAPLDVELTIGLWPGDAPLPAVEPPEGLTWPDDDRFDADRVALAVEARREDLSRCYAAALERDPGVWGRVAVALHVGERGRIAPCSRCAAEDAVCRHRCGPPAEHESRFPDREAARCVVAALSELDLDGARTGPASFVVAARFGSPPPR